MSSVRAFGWVLGELPRADELAIALRDQSAPVEPRTELKPQADETIPPAVEQRAETSDSPYASAEA